MDILLGYPNFVICFCTCFCSLYSFNKRNSSFSVSLSCTDVCETVFDQFVLTRTEGTLPTDSFHFTEQRSFVHSQKLSRSFTTTHLHPFDANIYKHTSSRPIYTGINHHKTIPSIWSLSQKANHAQSKSAHVPHPNLHFLLGSIRETCFDAYCPLTHILFSSKPGNLHSTLT